MNSSTHTVVIGAGPYGLTLAAHLKERGVPFRIFGKAMETWATQMPVGMKLKSDGFASNLFPGSKTWTLEEFCRETGREYHDTHRPVAVEDFIAYGQEFARRFVPTLEECNVLMVEPARAVHSALGRFRVHVQGGEVIHACEVVLAVGLAHFPLLPESLRKLPADLVSHTADHRYFHQFKGCDVTVLGRGASALNAAALLHEAGAYATVVSRKPKLHIHRAANGPGPSLLQRLRHPSTPLGPSLRSWFAVNFPLVFHALPGFVRRGMFYKHLGPAGGSSLRGRVRGKVPILTGWTIDRAEVIRNATGRRVKLTLVNAEKQTREQLASHIIAGTGFRVDINRLKFISPGLLEGIEVEKHGAPVLDRNFRTSVPGLYFVGPAAAASFGPLLRFTAGSRFTSQRLSRHLAKCFAREGRRRAEASLEKAAAPEGHAA